MTADRGLPGRLPAFVPVRLCDVPLRVRLAAANRVCRNEHDRDKQEEVLYAAMCPSEKTYWLPADRRILVEKLTGDVAA